MPDEIKPLPAFYPVIKPVDKDWEDLQITTLYSFKNRPYEFYNGNDFSAGGNRNQCWSASAALMGHYALKDKKVFTIHEDDTPVQ